MSDTFRATGSRFQGDGDTPPPDTAVEVVEMLDDMSPEEAYTWLNEHADDLTTEQMTGAYVFVQNAGQQYMDAFAVVEEEGGRRIANGTWEPPSSTNPTGGRPQQGANTTAFPEPTGSSPGEGATAPTPQAGSSPDDLEAAGSAVAEGGIDEDRRRSNFNSSIEEAQDAAAQQIVQAAQADGTILDDDLLGAVEDMMPDDLSPAEQGQWSQEVLDGAREQAVEQIAEGERAEGNSEGADQAAEDIVSNTLAVTRTTPRWMFEQAKARGQMVGGQISPEAQNRFLRYYNDLYGTTFGDFDELVRATGSLSDDATDEIQTVWDAALSGEDPLSYENMQGFALEVQVNQRGNLTGSGTRTVTVNADDMRWLRENTGLNTQQIRELTREVYMFGGDSHDLRSIASLQRFYQRRSDRLGLGTVGAQENTSLVADKRAELDQIEAEIAQVEASNWGPDTAGKAERLAELERRRTELRMTVGQTSGAGSSARGGPGIVGMQNRFNEGNAKYNNKPLAVIYAADAGLAARIAATGGDPSKMDPDDVAEAATILRDSGIAGQTTSGGVDSYWANDADVVADIIAYGGGVGGPQMRPGSGGGGGRVRRLVDDLAVKESVHELWRSMFREDAPEGLAAQFAKELQAALDKAPEGMDFDPNARLQQWIKSQEPYGRLYGRKPAGVDEGEWMGQFEAAQGSILGNEIPTGFDPVKAGMEAGEYQTAVGSAVGTKEAWGNSTWLERLAQAAQVVQGNT